MPPTPGRHHNQDPERERKRKQAQAQTQAVRTAAEEANDPAATDVLPGAGTPGSTGPRPARTRPTVREVLGGRRPAVLAGVRVRGNEIDIERFAPPGPLGDFVVRLLLHRFREGCKLLSSDKDKWEQLVGTSKKRRGAPTDWTARAALLRRIAASPSEGVPLDETSDAKKAPDEIGVTLLGGLLAELPDGTPFRLRWLLEPFTEVAETQHWYDVLNDDLAAMYRLVRAVLMDERVKIAAGDLSKPQTDEKLTRAVYEKAKDDPGFWLAFEVRCALLGLPPGPPVPKHLDTFRQALKDVLTKSQRQFFAGQRFRHKPDTVIPPDELPASGSAS